MEKIKELLGEELLNQVVEKLGDKKLAIINDGSYVPKAKFDEVNDQKNKCKKMLDERDKQLKELKDKAGDSEALTAKIQQQTFDYELEKALINAKAKNLKAVTALLDIGIIKFDGSKLLGLEAQLKALQKSDAYLFGEGSTSLSRDNQVWNQAIQTPIKLAVDAHSRVVLMLI